MQSQIPKWIETLRRLPGLLLAGLFNLPKLPFRLAGWMVDLVLSLSSLIVVVFKRLRHNLGLGISAILGVVAVLSIVVGVPIFSYSISSDVLQEQLIDKAVTTRRRLFSLHMYFINRSTT